MHRLVRAPVSIVLVLTAVALQAAMALDRRAGESSDEARRRWGAVVLLDTPGEPELAGAFDLWDGEGWRVPTSSLLHESTAGLILSSALLLAVGWRLEPRWGSRRVLSIWLLCSLSGFVVAYVVQETPLGLLSGTCGLVFAAGRVQRSFSEDEEPLLPVWLVSGVAATILLAAATTVAGFTQTPFIAWVAAAGCGSSIGARLSARLVLVRPYSPRGRLLPWLIAAGWWGAVHPIWLGTYHWHRARGERDPAERERTLKRAVEVDPELIGARIALADTIAERNDPHRAWATILESLREHRRDERIAETARRLWAGFPTEGDRTVARETLAEVFSDEAPHWQRTLGIEPSPAEGNAPQPQASEFPHREPQDAERFRLDQKIDLPPIDADSEVPPRRPKARPADPRDPEAAAEGRGV